MEFTKEYFYNYDGIFGGAIATIQRKERSKNKYYA
jgi:hypothetical protein